MKIVIINFFIFLSTNALARSIKPSLDRISTELYQVAAGIGVISLMVASIYLMSGKTTSMWYSYLTMNIVSETIHNMDKC